MKTSQLKTIISNEVKKVLNEQVMENTIKISLFTEANVKTWYRTLHLNPDEFPALKGKTPEEIETIIQGNLHDLEDQDGNYLLDILREQGEEDVDYDFQDYEVNFEDNE